MTGEWEAKCTSIFHQYRDPDNAFLEVDFSLMGCQLQRKVNKFKAEWPLPQQTDYSHYSIDVLSKAEFWIYRIYSNKRKCSTVKGFHWWFLSENKTIWKCFWKAQEVLYDMTQNLQKYKYTVHLCLGSSFGKKSMVCLRQPLDRPSWQLNQ